MNYWYYARPNEIFLDLDSNRAIGRALSVLRRAIRQRDLLLDSVWLYGTSTRGHAHMVVVLKDPISMSLVQRVAWSLWLGNDRLRAAYVLMRHERCPSQAIDLFVSTEQYHRAPDGYCHCKKKHKPKSVTDKCPAMTHLLGDARSADYFTRTGSAPPRRKIRVPWGKVSLMQIRNWKEVYERNEKGLLQHSSDVASVPEVGRSAHNTGEHG